MKRSQSAAIIFMMSMALYGCQGQDGYFAKETVRGFSTAGEIIDPPKEAESEADKEIDREITEAAKNAGNEEDGLCSEIMNASACAATSGCQPSYEGDSLEFEICLVKKSENEPAVEEKIAENNEEIEENKVDVIAEVPEQKVDDKLLDESLISQKPNSEVALEESKEVALEDSKQDSNLQEENKQESNLVEAPVVVEPVDILAPIIEVQPPMTTVVIPESPVEIPEIPDCGPVPKLAVPASCNDIDPTLISTIRGQRKVFICHKNGAKVNTISIACAALSTHVKHHGDYVGICD